MMSVEDVPKYTHSPAHLAVAQRDHAALRLIVDNLPRLAKAGEVNTEEESIEAERTAEIVSDVIDRRDVPNRETPLHLAIRLGDPISAEILMSAGADWSLQNENGWSALQESVCNREEVISLIIAKQYQPLAWAKWCRRLPRIVASVKRIRDFYMEISFHFESSVIPFIGRIAPSDTYRIWKRGSNLRADMTLSGFDGFRIQRSDQTFMFLGDGLSPEYSHIPSGPGSLLLFTHKKKEIANALEGAGATPTDSEVAREVSMMGQTNMYRPGIDVTQAKLVPHLNWRRHERSEMVGNWKAKVYDMHHVSVSVKSRKVPGAMSGGQLFPGDGNHKSGNGGVELDDILTPEERQQLKSAMNMENNAESGLDVDDVGNRKKMTKKEEDSVDLKKGGKEGGKRKEKSKSKKMKKKKNAANSEENPKVEGEFKKGLKPVLWLTPDFPLKTEELLPLLDVLANKVKAIRRLRELLTTKLPPGTFPVKIAIPVVPTIRVLVTFSKFEELEPLDEFTTPPSSPMFLEEKLKESSSWYSWVKKGGAYGRVGSMSNEGSFGGRSFREDMDPFNIPADYTWVDAAEKKRRMKAKRLRHRKNDPNRKKTAMKNSKDKDKAKDKAVDDASAACASTGSHGRQMIDGFEQ